MKLLRIPLILAALVLPFVGVTSANAAIALRGTPTTVTSTAQATSYSFNTPAAAVSGDLLVATFVYRVQTGPTDIANTAPAGWTKVPGEVFDPGPTLPGVHMVVAYKTAAGGAQTFSWTLASAPTSTAIAVSAYSGAATSSPFENASYATEPGGSSTTVHTAPAFTPTATGTWGVAAFGARASETWTPGTGLIERTDIRANTTGTGADDETADSNGVLTPGTAKTYSSTDSGGTSVADMFAGNIKPAPVETLLSQGKPATASSTEIPVSGDWCSTHGGCDPQKAVDGLTTTRWSSGTGDPQWIYVDLGSTFNVSHVNLNWEAAYASAYKIQTSPDAVTWTDIFSTTTGNGATDDLTGLSGTGRYVRMLGTTRATVWTYSLWEFQVFGSATGGDTTPPDTTITTAPSGATSSNSASIGFTGTDNVAVTGFECKLDAGAYAACTSPQAYSALSDGSHTVSVRAKDAAGNVDPTPATATWTVDTTAPNTTITAGPSGPTNNASPSFSFTSTESGSFECRIDGAAFASCTSPKSYTTLADGSHTFDVRAIDAVGNVDATPASSTFTVDTIVPDTTITAQPANPTTATTADFSFTASESGVTFQCALDGAAYATCTSPKSYTVTTGSHTFTVKATDAASNTDATPASYTWTVNGAPPSETLLSQGKPVTSSSVEPPPNSSGCCAAGLAVDGNTTTRWASDTFDPQWIQVDLGATANITHVNLNWETAYGSSYQIQVSDDGTNWTTIFSTTTGNGGTDDLTGLSGTGRYIRMNGTVRGTVWGYSLWEMQVFGSFTGGGGGDTTAPTAPTNLAGTPGDTQASLSWTASTDNVGVTGYRVFRNGTQVGTPTGTTFTDTGLTNGTAYTYTVKAIDGAGNLSAASNSVSVTPQASSNPPPTGSYSHVVWVVMENHGYNQIIGNSGAPYINSLVSQYGSATNMFAESHPSLPNYLAMTSGSTQGITDDANPSSHQLNVENIFHQLGGGQSRSLMESMPSNCYGSDFTDASGGKYSAHHNPMAYYSNLGTDCANYDIPLASTPNVSSKFTFVVPNQCNNMHDCSVTTGDNFLSTFIPKIQSTADYAAGKTAIFVTWDEDETTEGNHIPTLIVHPNGAHDTSACQSTQYTHYSMLRFVQDNFGLARTVSAATANSMSNCFGLSNAPAQPNGPPGNWNVAFDDEFNGTSLDLTKWEPNWFGEGGVQNGVPTYARNVSVSNGEMRLQLANESGTITGALVHTAYTAGRYQLHVGEVAEARVYFPGDPANCHSGVYNFSAWWASGQNWPAAGEIDIAEVLGELTTNYHAPVNDMNGPAPAGCWANAYHTYTVWRQASQDIVYWDGVAVWTHPTGDNGGVEELIFNAGKSSGTPVTGAAGAIRVDYARAWSPAP